MRHVTLPGLCPGGGGELVKGRRRSSGFMMLLINNKASSLAEWNHSLKVSDIYGQKLADV